MIAFIAWALHTPIGWLVEQAPAELERWSIQGTRLMEQVHGER